jgi:nickel/cobalt transporter (NicO) family protein
MTKPYCSFSVLGFFVVCLSLCLSDSKAYAHPVPRGQHDRTIAVHIVPDPLTKSVAVTVNYRLEVDELTVILEDMTPFLEEVQFDKYKNKPMEFYGEFTRIYAPILANNLTAKVDGKVLKFRCDKRSHRKTDEAGNQLGHLRCDFVFSAAFPLDVGQAHAFAFHEGNYRLQTGQILLSYDFGPTVPLLSLHQGVPILLERNGGWSVQVVQQSVPDPVLQSKTALQMQPGDDEKLRPFSVTFVCSPSHSLAGAASAMDERWALRKRQAATLAGGITEGTVHSNSAEERAAGTGSELFDLFLSSKQGIVVILLLSLLVGAAHALTPGHGKTLVAAYLVGQRGTVGHAFILGLVTTITHTGIVLLIALGLLFVDEESRQEVARSLGLAMGVALVCLGFWLLLQRLAGQADHFHLPGQGHHHHHHHDERPAVDNKPLRWGGLLVMGMTGGMAPCWDAVAMLVLAIGTNLLWLALPMLLAFSAGLASVLVLIGILVVHARKLVDARWSNSRLVRLLPILSAMFIAVMGILVCYQGVQGEFHGNQHTRSAATARP